MDCLRFKRWVDGPQWLEKNQPDFAQWLLGRKLAVSAPYSYMSYRYATEGGAMVAVDVLADRRLLRPRTRNNEDSWSRAGLRCNGAMSWPRRCA